MGEELKTDSQAWPSDDLGQRVGAPLRPCGKELDLGRGCLDGSGCPRPVTSAVTTVAAAHWQGRNNFPRESVLCLQCALAD